MVTLSWLFIACCLLSCGAGLFLLLLLMKGEDDGVGCLVIILAAIWIVFALAQFLVR